MKSLLSACAAALALPLVACSAQPGAGSATGHSTATPVATHSALATPTTASPAAPATSATPTSSLPSDGLVVWSIPGDDGEISIDLSHVEAHNESAQLIKEAALLARQVTPTLYAVTMTQHRAYRDVAREFLITDKDDRTLDSIPPEQVVYAWSQMPGTALSTENRRYLQQIASKLAAKSQYSDGSQIDHVVTFDKPFVAVTRVVAHSGDGARSTAAPQA